MTDQEDRFISPCKPPEGYERELLTILIEEAAEVQQRATKALRFGIEEVQPGQPHSNAYRIGLELGDFFEVLDRCFEAGVVADEALGDGMNRKRDQLERFLQNRPETSK